MVEFDNPTLAAEIILCVDLLMRILDTRGNCLMSYTIAELRAKSDEELIAEHGKLSRNVVLNVNYYLQELARRESVRQTEAMISLTRKIAKLMIAVTLLTGVNVVVAAVAVLV